MPQYDLPDESNQIEGSWATLSRVTSAMTIGAVGIADIEPRLANADWVLFYENDVGVVTYRHRSKHGAWFLKVAPSGVHPSLDAEEARMRWARAHLPVPEVCGTESTESGGSWLLTLALPGDDATRSRLRDDPKRLAEALAGGLRRFHETPREACPFSFRADASLALAQERARRELVSPERDFHPAHAHLSADQALAQLLSSKPASEDVVVCHGDYCLPNAIVEDDAVTGFVDLGGLAVADRWWDLATATRSISWNLGDGFDQVFLDAYGVSSNPAKLAYYRLLYDVVS